MKKSQVLAALALAMALGVVAPVASTFAVTNVVEQCKEAKEDVADLIREFGDQTSVAPFSNLSAHMDNLNAAYAPSASSLKAAWAAYKATPSTPAAGTIRAVFHIVKSALDNGAKVREGNGYRDLTIGDFAGKNYDQVLTLAGADTTYYNRGYDNDSFKADKQTANGLMNLYIKDVTDDLTVLDMKTNVADDADAATILAYVNGLPNYTKTAALLKVYNKNVCTGTDAQIEKITKNLNNGIAAFKAGTTNNDGDNAGEEQKPTTPDTGANTASEESATASVSILSGVASVVTAAGVVIRKAFRK